MGSGISAISRRSSGISSPRNTLPACMTASAPCFSGPRSTFGATSRGRGFPSCRCILPATASATARSARSALPSRSKARPRTSLRSSASWSRPGNRSGQVGPWTTSARTRSSVFASPDTCDMAHDVRPLVRAPRGRAMPIVIVGHVDHGKSPLVGRLLHDTNSLSDAKVAELRVMSAKRGLDVEWSFLLDALQVERDQGITVDTTHVWFQSSRRRYVIIDAPGHREFLRNMLTGAASADAAILVVDAKIGVSEQTRRHAYLLNLIGLKQVIVAINKMDLVGGDRDRFDGLASEVGEYLAGIGIRPLASVPVSAKHGDNIATASLSMPWYRGPTLVEALDAHESLPPPAREPLRFPVQDVYRFGDRRA